METFLKQAIEAVSEGKNIKAVGFILRWFEESRDAPAEIDHFLSNVEPSLLPTRIIVYILSAGWSMHTAGAISQWPALWKKSKATLLQRNESTSKIRFPGFE
jgi:hypothetical protein